MTKLIIDNEFYEYLFQLIVDRSNRGSLNHCITEAGIHLFDVVLVSEQDREAASEICLDREDYDPFNE